VGGGGGLGAGGGPKQQPGKTVEKRTKKKTLKPKPIGKANKINNQTTKERNIVQGTDIHQRNYRGWGGVFNVGGGGGEVTTTNQIKHEQNVSTIHNVEKSRTPTQTSKLVTTRKDRDHQ